MQHLSWRHLSISGISQLLLNRFGPNFESRFVGQYLKDAHFQGDICPNNICPGKKLFISAISQLLLPRFWPKLLDLFFGKLYFCTTHCLDQTSFDPNIFLTQKVFDLTFFNQIFFWPFIFQLKIFNDLNFLDLNFLDW